MLKNKRIRSSRFPVAIPPKINQHNNTLLFLIEKLPFDNNDFNKNNELVRQWRTKSLLQE